MRYYAGKVLPGSETRAVELAGSGLDRILETTLAPGTFNVDMLDNITLGPPDVEHGPYHLWACRVSTRGMIERDEPGHSGWVLRVVTEDLPANFLEIISPIHLRTALNRQNWPSFDVEVALT